MRRPVREVAVVQSPAVLQRPAASSQAGQHQSVSLQHHLPSRSVPPQVGSNLWHTEEGERETRQKKSEILVVFCRISLPLPKKEKCFFSISSANRAGRCWHHNNPWFYFARWFQSRQEADVELIEPAFQGRSLEILHSISEAHQSAHHFSAKTTGMKHVTRRYNMNRHAAFLFFLGSQRICQVSTNPALLMYWQQTCFECLRMNITDVFDSFQSEWYLWLEGVKGEMYVCTACQEYCCVERQCVCVTARITVQLCPTLQRRCTPATQQSSKYIPWNNTATPPLAVHNIWWTAANDWNNPDTGVYWTAGVTGSLACWLWKGETLSSKRMRQ